MSTKLHRAVIILVPIGLAAVISVGILLTPTPENNEFMRLERAEKALGQQFSVVKDRETAEAAIEVWQTIINTNRLDYPHSPEHVMALEVERRRAVEKIHRALVLYSGRDFGSNQSQWEAWIKTNEGVSDR